jgi:predicted acyl esterase
MLALTAFGCGLTTDAVGESFRFETVSVMTGDSVALMTDLYLPMEGETFPAVLLRTPYGSKQEGWIGKGMIAAGYAVVVQNVRGMNGSGGSFFPFVYEMGDGMQTVQWILNQPWSNGKILLYGTSYQGFSAFEIARTGHPALVALIHTSAFSDLVPFMSHGGAFHLMAHLRWFYSYAAGQPDPPLEAWDAIYRSVPIADFFRGAEALMEEVATEPYDYESIRIPVLHITGWYDYIYPNVIQTYEALNTSSSADRLQHLWLGPWAHNDMLNGITAVGDEDFGPEAKMGTDWVVERATQWFNHALKVDEGIAREKAVNVFVMGDNEWHQFDVWPPAELDYQKWYIDCGERANSATGSGVLGRDLPSLGKQDTFVFDPNDPVPTMGGANFHFPPKNIGPRDQSQIEARNDVLVYTSAPLADDLLIVGPIKAVVYAATEGPDTDFTAKLTVVHPDGYVRNVEDGILRGRYLNAPSGTPQMLNPGQVYRFEIDCGATALRVKAGERLRVEVSSSNFPKYDRNPNTGVEPLEATEFVAVTQTVYHTREYASHIIIPVLP